MDLSLGFFFFAKTLGNVCKTVTYGSMRMVLPSSSDESPYRTMATSFKGRGAEGISTLVSSAVAAVLEKRALLLERAAGEVKA